MTLSGELNIDLDKKFPHLAGAPIVEAVIHWQTIAHAIELEEFRQRLTDRMHDYPEPAPIRKFALEAKVETDGPADFSSQESQLGWRFTSSDGRYVVQFMREGLVFSRLKPYEGWRTFAADARRLWGIFAEIVRPGDVQRLGVRFINRIASVGMNEVGRILTRPPARLGSLGLPVRDFMYQSMHDVPGHPYRLNVIDTVQSEMILQPEGSALILDIDAFTTRSIGATEAEIDYHLDRLRWLKNTAFFNLIRKPAISRFRKAQG
jgi:uncharacterized protein (TIGR04255 family)